MIQKDLRILERRTEPGKFSVLAREAETDDGWTLIGSHLSPYKVGLLVKSLLKDEDR